MKYENNKNKTFGIDNVLTVLAKKKHYISFFILLALFLLLFLFLKIDDSKQIEVQKGILNIESYDMEMKTPISLSGEWEFYWKQFLTNSDISEAEPDLLVKVPSTWNEYSLDGQRLSGDGYGTYRIHVKEGHLLGEVIGLRIQTFSSAYRLYVDDKLVAKNGNISNNVLEEVGEYKPQTVYFSAPSDEFDIIIQVSNHHYARGGFWSPMYIGSQSQIMRFDDSVIMKNMMVIGAFLIVAMFYISSFILMKENKANLYFGLLCLSSILAYDTAGQLLLTKAISGLSINTMIFIWYSSSIWSALLILLYMSTFYESSYSRIAVRVYMIIVIIIQTCYILIPPSTYTAFGRIANNVELFGLLVATAIAVMGVVTKKKSSGMNLISILIILIVVVHDVLYYTSLIHSSYGEIMYVGFFIFLLIQMLIKAINIKDYYENKNAAELKFLQAQIKPHFLYNALNAIISISREEHERSTNLLITFSNYLRGSFDFKSTDNETLLRKEIEHVNAYLEIEKARFEERIEFTVTLPVYLDYYIPVLVMQPIIENAIVHGLLPKPEGGKVELNIAEKDEYLEFSVKDNGIGMDSEIILKQQSDEFKNGIALANIDSRLRRLYGTGLRIVSEKMMGTEVLWRIPIIERGKN